MMKHSDITEKIIKAAFNVHNVLGFGFREHVYHKAMCIELKNLGLNFKSQKFFDVLYENMIVGRFIADLFVEEVVIVELKAVEDYKIAFEAQLLNYLRSSGLSVGLIINFEKTVKIKRMVL